MKIKFEQKEGINVKKIFLDDKDISSYVKSFTFNATCSYLSSVTLELYPSDIEIEAENFKLIKT